ncbi:hypothetical protein ACQKLP_05500 [Chitinophaga sp. NPDC101104]|uniref:hypothetical protein n=1 Tax=Chitinophaga sp. NPDC101104 TaxID=3390561 RepID=UPI003D060D56
MDYIPERARRFLQTYFRDIDNHESIISAISEELEVIFEKSEKVKFINLILEENNSKYVAHKSVCKKPDTCVLNYSHESINYFLTGRLRSLDIQIPEDAFTVKEKHAAEDRLDYILEDLSKIKAGQQVLYEEFKKEIEELRGLFYLGKKNWRQLLLGKSMEMVAGGIISETVSKQVIESFSDCILLI